METRATLLSLLIPLCSICAPGPAVAETPAKVEGPGPKAAPKETPKATTDPTVLQIVDRVQKLYEKTTDLHAQFTQTLTGVMGNRTASGQVWLKKPGKMRWDYEKPDKKLFIADGTQLWVYEPEDEQAFRQPLSSSQLPAQVSFLFGKGRLASDFDISTLEEKGLGTPGDILLKLVPKAATAQYRYLAFVVDPKSYLVKETVVYDQQGGQNHLSFANIEMNLKGGISDSRFQFTPPPGTKEIKVGK